MSTSIGAFRLDRVVESEGAFAPISEMLPTLDRAKLAAADWIRPHYLDANDSALMCFQSFVLRTARHTILIDTCVGNDKERPLRPNWHRQQFPYLARLAAVGVQPEEVDLVMCTHLHTDHIGWNTRLVDGRWVPTFPNARYLFARKEYDYWEAENRQTLAAGNPLPSYGAYVDSVLPIVEAGRATMVDSDHEIETGIHLEAAYGHTPGSCLLHAKNGGAHAVFIGDAMHTPVQLVDPSWSSKFCTDPIASAQVRRTICEQYAETATTLVAAHFPSPTIGTIRRGQPGRSEFRLELASG